MNYYYTDKSNQTQGPVSIEQLQSMAASGAVNSSTMVVPSFRSSRSFSAIFLYQEFGITRNWRAMDLRSPD